MVAEQLTSIVGQSKAKNMLTTWQSSDSFPHFLIISGDKGSGRLTLSKEFARMLDARIHIQEELSAEAIRNMIAAAYDVPDKLVCVIPNADSMSISAKNLLLKLTEEPPENGYIIMTLLSLENTLNTLLSRSLQIVMEPYSVEELKTIVDEPLLCKVATTPGMLKELQEHGVEYTKGLTDFCNKLLYHVDTVTSVNALKSATRVKFKDSDTANNKYELEMFFAGMNYELNKAFEDMSAGEQPADWYRLKCWYDVLTEYNFMFNRPALNKQAVYDQLIFLIRYKLKLRRLS